VRFSVPALSGDALIDIAFVVGIVALIALVALVGKAVERL
jgi:hypothetical protein